MQPVQVIPKKLLPGKWRLILDLFSSEDRSVNVGIPKDGFSIRYISVDVAIKVLMEMAKFDVLSAYRNIPIHQDDRHFAGHVLARQLLSRSRVALWSPLRPLHF